MLFRSTWDFSIHSFLYYGMPLWRVTKLTVVDAMLKTALSISRTKKEAARFLGIDYNDFNKMLKKYKTKSFFEDGGETVSTEEIKY